MEKILAPLTCRAFVNPDAVHNRSEVIEIVKVLMGRVALGLPGSDMILTATNFRSKYWGKVEARTSFEEKIREIVEELIASLDEGDGSNYKVFVTHLRRREFKICILPHWFLRC